MPPRRKIEHCHEQAGHWQSRVTILPKSLRPYFLSARGKPLKQLTKNLGKSTQATADIEAKRDLHQAECKVLFGHMVSLSHDDRQRLVAGGGVAAFLEQTKGLIAHHARLHAFANRNPTVEMLANPETVRELIAARAAGSRFQGVLAGLQDVVEHDKALANTLQPAPVGPPTDDPMRISAVCDRMLASDAERKNKRNPRTAEKIRERVARFVRSQGDLSICDPTLRDAADRFLNECLARSKGGLISGAQVLASTLQGVTKWANERSPHPRDLLAGLKAGLGTDDRTETEKRDPWDDKNVARIVRILSTSTKDWGDPLTSDSSAALLLMIGSGCRPHEALQARGMDVRQEGQQWFLDIDGWYKGKPPKTLDGGPRRTIKTAPSRRVVPIHPAIVPAIRAAQERHPRTVWLFNDVAQADTEEAVRAFNAPIRRLKKALSIDNPKLSAHSFRHRMQNLCDDAERAGWMTPKDANSFLGHSTAAYGSPTPPETLAPIVARLDVLAGREIA